MYVAKYSKSGLKTEVMLLDKQWSSLLLSHEIRDIGSKKFFFRFRACHWVRNEIIKDIVKQHQLEIING